MVLKFARTATGEEVFGRAIGNNKGGGFHQRQSWREWMSMEVTLGLFVQHARRGWLNET